MSEPTHNAVILGTISLGAAAVTIFSLRAWLTPSPLPGIPHLKGPRSILGDLPAMGKAATEHGAVVQYFFEANAHRLGAIYQILVGPFNRIVVVSDAQEIEDILLRRGKSFIISKAVTDPISGLFPYFQLSLPTDEMWRKHRRLTGASMTSKYLRTTTSTISDHALQLVTYWKEKILATLEHGGVTFEAQDDLQFCTGDVIGSICLGESLDGLNSAREALAASSPDVLEHGAIAFPDIKGSPFHQATRLLFEALGNAYEWPPFLVPVYWFTKRLDSKHAAARTLVKTFVQNHITEARARIREKKDAGISTDDADCVLDMVMGQEGSEDMMDTTDEELVDELTGYIFAGQETTAVTMSWGLKYLSNNPDVQTRLRQELLSQLPDSPESRPLSYDDVMSDKTPYLEAVVAETLRCANVASFTIREAAEDVTIFGRAVPKGTLVALLNGYAGLSTSPARIARVKEDGYDALRSSTSKSMGLSKGLWEDKGVDQFNPQRWLVEAEVDGPNGQRVKDWKFSSKQGYSVPFSMGQRTCFGFKLATLELKILFATLTLAFYFDKVPQELNSFEPKEVLTRQPKVSHIAPKAWSDAAKVPFA